MKSRAVLILFNFAAMPRHFIYLPLSDKRLKPRTATTCRFAPGATIVGDRLYAIETAIRLRSFVAHVFSKTIS